MTKAFRYVASKTGTCGRCIRSSAFLAAATWCLAGALYVLSRDDLVPYAMFLATSSSVLAVAHLGAYAGRIVIALRGSPPAEKAGMPGRASRRSFVLLALKTVSSAILLTLAGPIMNARADCPSGYGTCGNTGFCCDLGWYYCDNCNGQRNKCVRPTDEALYHARSCCSVLVRCA